MTKLTGLTVSVCTAALLSAGSATADVTAAEVWTEWQEMISLYGEDSLSFTTGDTSNGDLTIEDLKMTIDAEDDIEVTADIGTLVFDSQDDGTVIITMADSYPIIVKGQDGEEFEFTITQSGMQMVASGEPDELSYTVSADRYGVVVDEFRDPSGASFGDMRFIANDLSGTYLIKTDDMRNIDYSLQTGSVDILADITDPESGGTFLFSGKMNQLNVDAGMALPLDFDPEKPELMFTSGLRGNGSYTFASADYIFDFKDGSDSANGSVSMGTGSVIGGMNDEALSYDASLRDLALNVTVPDLPFPVSVTTAEYGFGLTMPLAPTEEPADVGLKINLIDLGVNDEIWMMGDPTNAIPHDPVTVKLDLVGKAKLLFNLFDPEEAEAMAFAEAPGELYGLTLNDLTLRAAGAEVTGTGDFTFDNSDLETFDGLPRPMGSVTVNINGANQLIDSLVGMGLLPEEQAMMGRMMMGMFARTVGEDQLTSTLEINEQGHVLANGQRIQ